jgi:cell division protein FtsQ
VTTKQIIRKIIFLALTLTACSGLVVLLVAAIGRRNHELCKDYVITMHGAQKDLFINEKDIKKLLNAALNGKIKGEPITDFNLRKLEQLLKGNAWVKNANLYFDNREVLHISIEEKEPVARIFTTTGKSFYIDKEGEKMPLSEMMSARVPVFTNFPDLPVRQAGKKVLSTKDSVLLNDIRGTASFVLKDSFWMAQTEQIDITEDRNFEMIPTIGHHVVKLGKGNDIENKFRRLLIFYQQVLSKTSFDKYNIVDVQYTGQVIGSKTRMSKVDSMQLKKNIEKLLQEARRMQTDTIAFIPAPGNDVSAEHTAKPKNIEDKAEEKSKAVMPVKN